MIQQHRSVLRFTSQLSALTLALTLATFGWVVWNAYASYRGTDSLKSRDLRVEELRGVILHLDEVLTMSARMAAATGDLRWETRYHESEPTLDAAIKETIALAPDASGGSTQTDAANAKLVAMEQQAFALVRAGRAADARAVLFAPAYEEQKALYAGGMTALLSDVRARVDRGLRQTKQRALLSMAGSALLLGLSIVVACLCGFFLLRAIRNLAALLEKVQQSGVQVNASVTEIAATAREQQATASEIAATTTEIGATSREISSTSRKLVETMNEVAMVAEQSALLAGQGQNGLTHMEETMRRVMDAAASINAKLAVLSEKAGNISQVVTTITKVADQTNLLSLNAAIEAEKAGEYGRGFAVVATEIRRLADQTAVSTYDIEQMVKEIQSAVAAGVMGMDKFSEEVRRGMHDMQQVGGQLSQVIQQVQALAPRIESVNEGMQAQSSSAEQITQALMQLSEAAQQTVDSLRESGLAIDELNQVAIGLRGGVSRFTLQAA